MKLIFYFILGSIIAFILASVSDVLVMERQAISKAEEKIIIQKMIDTLAVRLRYSVDRASANACPTGTNRRNLRNSPKRICWPSNNTFCTQVQNLLACIDRTRSVSQQNWKLNPLESFLSSSKALAAEPTAHPAAGEGFHITYPACTSNDQVCQSCADLSCMSFTISVCRANRQSRCSGPRSYWVQTIKMMN